jgi:hypothetical protein
MEWVRATLSGYQTAFPAPPSTRPGEGEEGVSIWGSGTHLGGGHLPARTPPGRAATLRGKDSSSTRRPPAPACAPCGRWPSVQCNGIYIDTRVSHRPSQWRNTHEHRDEARDKLGAPRTSIRSFSESTNISCSTFNDGRSLASAAAARESISRARWIWFSIARTLSTLEANNRTSELVSIVPHIPPLARFN